MCTLSVTCIILSTVSISPDFGLKTKIKIKIENDLDIYIIKIDMYNMLICIGWLHR